MMEQQILFNGIALSELEIAFREFHRENVHVWILFRRYTLAAINAGRRHYSSRAIMQRIRWDVEIETRNADGFKINNNHSPYYARMFMGAYPKYDGFFHTREVAT